MAKTRPVFLCLFSMDSSKQTPDTGKSKLEISLAHNRRYYAFLVFYLVVLSALGSFVNDMYSPALPAMCHFFGCSISLAQMGLSTGMMGLAAGQLILGPVSDRVGRKPVLIGALLLFIAGAVVSLFSPDIHFFNACRFIQGVGASGGYFLARTIPADIYTGRNLAGLMALIGAINGIAPASAPVIGGVTADVWGWKGIFVLLAAFAFVILLLSPLMKESLMPSNRVRGPFSATVEGYKSLLTNKAFMTHVCLKGTALGLLFAYISTAPFILQTHYGLSQTHYGLVIGFNSIFVASGSMLALKFRLLKNAAVTGAWIMAAGIVAEAVALYFIHSIWLFEIFIVISLFGLGMIFTSSNTLAMNEGRRNAGEASSVLGIAGYIVGAIVTPLVGIGNILHSSAVTFVILVIVVLFFARATNRIAPDLNK